MLLRDTFHTTYCTNIHPGEDWEETFTSLQEHLPAIKKLVSPDQKFGIGLRLSNKASEELEQANRLKDFKNWLDDNDCYVFTMNGFPYGNFHGGPVKDKVHKPDWTTSERLEYTKRLFDQLAVLLPEGVEGGISTSPISYTHWHTAADGKGRVMQAGARNLAQVAVHLFRLQKETGKYMHLDIEPEPDGMLENSEDVILFFKEILEPIAIPILREELGLNASDAKDSLFRYINLCYDVCHFSLAYEEPRESFQRLKDAGIRIGKIQLSSALRLVNVPNGDPTKALEPFNEDVYLHQVTQLLDNGVRTYRDLPDVLGKIQDFKELRAHFHVPIFLDKFGDLLATQDAVLEVLELLKEEVHCTHLEVETYTWEVLPVPLRLPIEDSITRELMWLKEKLPE